MVVARPLPEVVEVAADPRRLPDWAAGLAGAEVTPSEQPGVWVTDSPMGRALVRFTGGDDPGVLDHEVTLPDGSTTLNRFRASSCAGGTELVFLVEPAAGASADDHARDVAMVRADLERLRELLEG